MNLEPTPIRPGNFLWWLRRTRRLDDELYERRARGWLRRGVSGLRRLGSGSEGLAGARVGHQVRAARRPLQVLTVAVAGLVLAFWDRPSPAVLLTVALLAVLALVLIEVLASSADYPSARARSLEPGSAPPALPAAGEARTDESALPDQREATTEADRTHSSA